MNRPLPPKNTAINPQSQTIASAQDNSTNPPGVLRRLAAMIYDAMLMFGILFTATLIPSLILNHSSIKSVENGQVVHELHPLMTGLPFQLYLLSVWIVFFCWFWHRNGQTLGMQAWRLKVENLNGNNISLLQCLLRLLGASVSLLCLGIGYWWVWIDKEKRSWHDLWSSTQIILLPKK